LQGPFDFAHIVYGDRIFYDIYDDPEFIHRLLEMSCAAIIRGMDECLQRIPGSDTEVAHYNGLVMPRCLGGIKISEDTSTLLSKEMIQEFVTPYTNRILEYFHGGYIHFCGKNDHLLDEVMEHMPLAYGLNFGNPEKHDMEAVLQACAVNGKIFYGHIPRADEASLKDYFKKYLSSASSNGNIHLLLSYTCNEWQTPDGVKKDWNDALQEINHI